MCVGLPRTAEHLFLAALFFVSFFWASKRKKRKLTVNCRLITDDEIILFL